MILDTFRAIPKNIVFWLKFSERREKSTAGQNPGIPGDIKILCDPQSEKIFEKEIIMTRRNEIIAISEYYNITMNLAAARLKTMGDAELEEIITWWLDTKER